MAIYDKLCLSAGGGIISPWRGQQAENTVTILIGLGGTGIDCLRKIKTEVHNCLKPDDVNAKKAEYSHIRFLGVDDWFEKESEHMLHDGENLWVDFINHYGEPDCRAISPDCEMNVRPVIWIEND